MKLHFVGLLGPAVAFVASLLLIRQVVGDALGTDVTTLEFAQRTFEVFLAGVAIYCIVGRMGRQAQIAAMGGLAALELSTLTFVPPAALSFKEKEVVSSAWGEMTQALAANQTAALRLVSRSAQEGADIATVTAFCDVAKRRNGWRTVKAGAANQDATALCQAIANTPSYALARALARLGTDDARELLAASPADMRSAYDLCAEDEKPLFSPLISAPARAREPKTSFEGGSLHLFFESLASLQAAMPHATLRSPRAMGMSTRGGPGELILLVDRTLRQPVIATASPRVDAVGLVLPELRSAESLRRVWLRLRAQSSLRIEVEFADSAGPKSRSELFSCRDTEPKVLMGPSCVGKWGWISVPLTGSGSHEHLARITLWGDLSLADVRWEAT